MQCLPQDIIKCNIVCFRFHFPHGNPSSLNPYGDGKMDKFTEEFRRHKNASVNVDQLGDILKVSA